MINANYSINRLNAHELYNLAEFVVSENNESHICGSMSAAEQMKSVHSIHKEESTYYNDSIVYAVRNQYNSISGTIRTLKWNYSDELPIETIFGICPFQIMRQFQKSEVWHIGRFAISKNIRQIKLFKKLVMHAIQPICQNPKGIAIAECDSKLLRVLTMMGIESTTIGEPVNYLGSETIPICMTYEDLINFYNQNKGLLHSDSCRDASEEEYLPNSVVVQ